MFLTLKLNLKLLLNWVIYPAVYVSILVINDLQQELISFFLSDISSCLEEAEPEESEEPFVAPPGLAIPPDVELVSIKYPAGLLLLMPCCAFIYSIYAPQINMHIYSGFTQ